MRPGTEALALGTDKKHMYCVVVARGSALMAAWRRRREECFDGDILVFVLMRAGTGILHRDGAVGRKCLMDAGRCQIEG